MLGETSAAFWGSNCYESVSNLVPRTGAGNAAAQAIFTLIRLLADHAAASAARRGGLSRCRRSSRRWRSLVAAGGGIWWWWQNRDTSNARHGHSAAHGRPRRFRAHRHRARRNRGVRRHRSPLAREIEQHDRQRHPADRARRHGRQEGRLPGGARFVGPQAQRTTQKILVNTAKALEVEAHNTYDTAVIAKREYLEGTNLQERQTIESEVFVAEENLNRAKEYYAYSQKLASKGYVNENCSSRPIGSPSRRRTRTSTRPRPS